MSHPSRAARGRGSVYVHVLASSLLITILGLGSLAAVRVQMRSARLGRDSAAARTAALAAVELGLTLVHQDPNWRTTRPNGTWLDRQELGGGELTLQGTDPGDGVLSDSVYEPLVLTGIGKKGLARHQVQVTLEAIVKPLDALSSCLHASGPIQVVTGKRVTALGAPVSTNGSLNNLGTIDGDVQAQTAIVLGDVKGDPFVPGPVKPMPPACVFSDYVSKATTVPYAATRENLVLGPGCNPLGPADPNGLYVINTGGGDFTLRNRSEDGTLIIRAAGRTVIIDEAVFLQNYRSDFPVLLVEGNLILKPNSVAGLLSEVACNTNFNPIGAPYDGMTDGVKDDPYPDEIRGLVHVKGSLTLQSTARVVGVVICEGSVSCEEASILAYDPGLHDNPPTGYTYVDGMKISPGSWKQVVD